jgi:hypothetical protein
MAGRTENISSTELQLRLAYNGKIKILIKIVMV